MNFESSVALVMVAGRCRRFGSGDKRQALLPNGQSLQLKGDTGGRQLIRRFRSHCHELPVSDPGVTFDIDTAEDIEQTPHKKKCSRASLEAALLIAANRA